MSKTKNVTVVAEEDKEDQTRESLSEKSMEMAKNIVAYALNNMLTVFLLLLLFIGCGGENLEDTQKGLIKTAIESSQMLNGTINIEDASKEITDKIIKEGLDYKECAVNAWGNQMWWVLIILSLGGYSLLAALLVWFHAKFYIKKEEKLSNMRLYRVTDSFPIIDSILEIPIAFAVAPIATGLLWLIFAGNVCLLFFIGKNFAKDGGNMNAYLSNSVLIGYQLIRINGDLSQYYVFLKQSRKVDVVKRYTFVEEDV